MNIVTEGAEPMIYGGSRTYDGFFIAEINYILYFRRRAAFLFLKNP